MPKIFHVNWFRQKAAKFLWPGYCENVRVLDLISRRTEGEDIAVDTPVGLLPKKGIWLCFLITLFLFISALFTILVRS